MVHVQRNITTCVYLLRPTLLLYVLNKFWCQIHEDCIHSFPIVTTVVLHLCLVLQARTIHSCFQINYFSYYTYCYCFPSMSWSVGMVMLTANSAIGTLVNLISLIIQPSLYSQDLVSVLSIDKLQI